MANNIKHIVYLMLENRSLDQVLGWLYDDKNPPKKNIPSQTNPTYNGLKPSYFNVDSSGQKHFVVKGTNNNMNVPVHDPHEEYAHVNNQVFGTTTTPTSPTPPTMGGFYQDFASFNVKTGEIMESYTPEELPVLNGLAKNFAVSDMYFSSVPTQTDCNRAFAACGNSLGNTNDNVLEAWVNNRGTDYIPPNLSQPKGRQFNQKTIWNVLSENGYDTPNDWMLYNSNGNWLEDFLGVEGYSYTRDLMQTIQDPSFDNHFANMSDFLENAKAGTLPTFSFLEPEWGLEIPVDIFGDYIDIGAQGTDYHPPTNLAPGEVFVKSIYDALTSNKEAWDQTLFIINFDEHGGTYDHEPTPWGAKAPWDNSADGTPTPAQFEGDFQFDRFGVRVPLILVSPLIEASTVFRAEGNTPYDHTSVLATILNIIGIPKDKWQLGSRTANAPTFENVFQGNPLRTDIPEINANAATVVDDSLRKTVGVNDIQLRMMESIINKTMQEKGLTANNLDELAIKKLDKSKTLAELSSDFVNIIKKIKGI
ncbi:alkaline phosphatase family protein [Tenacibaculum sp. 190524A05c]|uniref:alkaline phosphatase family protein n=1 Tax=Tenacibaculum platacis TaxID=3137852 RepID=UPI0031FA7FB4